MTNITHFRPSIVAAARRKVETNAHTEAEWSQALEAAIADALAQGPAHGCCESADGIDEHDSNGGA